MRFRAVLAFVVALPWLLVAGDVRSDGTAAAPSSLAGAVRSMVTDKAWKDAQIGVAIMDVDSGAMLASYNEHGALNPASNAKLYTASAALAILHGDHRFETTLSGTVKGADVSGLTLRGHGDPSLTTEDLRAMVVELRAHGVRKVDGDVLVDQRFFDDQTTPPAFDQKPSEWAAFRAPVSAVAINENTITLAVRPAESGQPAHTYFDPPGFVDTEGTVTTGEGADTVVLGLTPNGHRLSAKLAGAVGADAKLVRYTRRVDDPTLLPGYVLKAQLDKEGISVSGDVKSGTAKGNVLVKHTSEPLSALLYSLGKQSDNFYAEMVFKSLALEEKGKPAKAGSASEIVTAYLTEIGAWEEGDVVKNGSGLFDANRVTASTLTKLLRTAYRDGSYGSEFVAQLSIGGSDGTLRHRYRDLKPRHVVRAKTGTLEAAASLSGYVMAPPGKQPIAFAILINGVAGKVSNARAAMDKCVEAIAAYLWKGE